MFYIQKSLDRGETWIDWDIRETREQAIGTVKQYALGDKSAFRVIEVVAEGNLVAFQWGPFEPIQPVE